MTAIVMTAIVMTAIVMTAIVGRRRSGVLLGALMRVR